MSQLGRMIGAPVKKMLKAMFGAAGLEIRRVPREEGSEVVAHSAFEEEAIIHGIVEQLPAGERFCVDIGASDGMSCSNTYALFRAGWPGLAVECDGQKFATLAARYKTFPGVRLSNCRATPENVEGLLQSHGVPRHCTVLSLDIDGYDYFVLDSILQSFRPQLICTEINEKIPPPIKFTVKWAPDYSWATDHFYGQSISQLATHCDKHQYSLVRIELNNVFLMPREISPLPTLTPEEAYRKGYVERPDRKEKLPWNSDMEALLTLPPEEALQFIRNYFAKYEGKFICEL